MTAGWNRVAPDKKRTAGTARTPAIPAKVIGLLLLRGCCRRPRTAGDREDISWVIRTKALQNSSLHGVYHSHSVVRPPH